MTGASAGLGKVYADRLAKRGYDLILVARRKERFETLSREVQQKYGIQAEVLVADLGNEVDLKRVGDVITADERITMLINNAGTSVLKPSIDIPVERVKTLFKPNEYPELRISYSKMETTDQESIVLNVTPVTATKPAAGN